MAFQDNQYNKILREYDNLQSQIEYELNKKRKTINKAIPEFKVLEDELITLATSSGRMAVLGDPKALQNLDLEMNKIRAKQNDLLLAHGYPKDFLSPSYTCNKCRDTGYVDDKQCSCFKQAIADLIYTGYSVKETLAKENFDNFSLDFYSNDVADSAGTLIESSPRDNMKNILATVKKFVANFDTSHDNLFLMGNTGVGKTFLANCIANELLDKGKIVIYLTSFRLFDILEQYKFHRDYKDSGGSLQQFNYILDCELLIIDDLGTEMNNTFITSQLYLVINERLLRQKSTIISTNLSLDNLITNYSERIYSRIISSYSIHRIIGHDIRLLKI